MKFLFVSLCSKDSCVLSSRPPEHGSGKAHSVLWVEHNANLFASHVSSLAVSPHSFSLSPPQAHQFINARIVFALDPFSVHSLAGYLLLPYSLKRTGKGRKNREKEKEGQRKGKWQNHLNMKQGRLKRCKISTKSAKSFKQHQRQESQINQSQKQPPN